MYNDYLGYEDSFQLQFYQVKDIERYTSVKKATSNLVMAFTMRAADKTGAYETKVFSIFDVFAQIGGIKNSLMAIGLTFCAMFEYNLFLSSMIRQLFHFPAKFDSERKDLMKKKKKGKHSSSSEEDSQKKIKDSSQKQLLSNEKYHHKSYISEALIKDTKNSRDERFGVKAMKDEINTVIGRKFAANFNLKTLGILEGVIRCFICRKSSKLRHNAKKRQHMFFMKGQQRLDKELDIANIIKNIRKIKYLMKILLDKDQRRLLKLKQSEFISTDTEEYNQVDYKKAVKKNALVGL